MGVYNHLAVALAIGVVLIHAVVALNAPGLSEDGYLYVRHVDSIRDNGLPMRDDPLSPVGKKLMTTPFYDYVVALFAVFLPVVVALKIVPALFSGLFVFLVFIAARRMTKDGFAALCAAIAASTMPVLAATINTGGPVSLVLSLTVLIVLLLQGEMRVWVYVLLIVALSFTHASVVLVLLGLLFYAGLLVSEEFKIERSWWEILIFSTVFVLWSVLVRFGKTISDSGGDFMFLNAPLEARNALFGSDILGIILLAGVVPSLVGAFMIYTFVFREHRRDVLIVIGFTLAMGLLLWSGLVTPLLGVSFLGAMLALLFGIGIHKVSETLRVSRASAFRVPALILVMVVLCASSIVPAYSSALSSLSDAPSGEELDFLDSTNLANASVVMALPEEGYLLQSVANVRVVQDSDYILQKDAAQRYDDIKVLFRTKSTVTAVGIMARYEATHLYVSEEAMDRFGRPSLIEDDCFVILKEGVSLLVERTCEVRK